MYIDYVGNKLSLIDRETGEIILVEIFVSMLPYSQLTCVEAVMTARVRKRRDKALVNGAVKLIIYIKLGGRESYDLKSLNAAIRVALELHSKLF